MLKISAVYLIGKAELPIHYTTWALVEQALLPSVFPPVCLDIYDSLDEVVTGL